MNPFVFNMPTKVLIGPGQLSNLHEENMPGKKALIVTTGGESVKKYGYLERVEKELELAGAEHVLFDQVRPNPTVENVMDGAEAAKENGCDFVVALGGGSVMDCTKSIALMVSNEGHLWDYSHSGGGGKKDPKHDAIPIICITTSAGTGSEVDCEAVISHDTLIEKSSILHPSMFPTISVVDADLMMTVPPHLTACQGIDAFFHATESVINTTENPIGEMFALKAIELIAKNLPIAYEDGSNREARANMALANTLAGYYMLCTSGHSIEHVMGSYHPDLIHGAGLAMTGHAYYNFFAERKAAEIPMIKMAKAMGVENPTSGMDFIKALDELLEKIGCADLKMSEEGITREELKLYPKRIHEILGGDTEADPLHLSDEDYLEIYEKSYR